MRYSATASWICALAISFCFTTDNALAQRQIGGPRSTPTDCDTNDDDGTGENPGATPGNGTGGAPGTGGENPGNGSDPGNGGQNPDNGDQTPGDGGEDPNDGASELTPFEELICQLIAEEIVFGNQEFGLLLYFIFAADDEVLSNCVIEHVFELFLMGSEPSGP